MHISGYVLVDATQFDGMALKGEALVDMSQITGRSQPELCQAKSGPSQEPESIRERFLSVRTNWGKTWSDVVITRSNEKPSEIGSEKSSKI